jgi:hypothetical protein
MRFDFTPLFRSTVGFDRLFDTLDQISQHEAGQSYPPYNIERTGENEYRVTVAVAGFAEKDLNVEVRDGVLAVTGKREEPDNAAKTGYIHGYGDAMQVSAGKLDSLSIAGDLFHWRGSNKIIKQISHELSISELTPDQAVKKLDTLYANPKYSELDLGQAMQLLTARADETSVPSSTPANAAPAKVAPAAPVSRAPIR